jgi:hypothetical protein
MKISHHLKKEVAAVEKNKTEIEKMDRYICCACHTDEHVIRLIWEEDYPNEIFLHYHLVPAPFFNRIWIAIKYVFGFKSKYGMFGEFVITNENKQNMIDVLNKIPDDN